jgi:hypothetical protein
MPSIRFSSTATVTAATSITVPLGGSPNPGDLVLVFLLVNNEIITRQPNWATEFTNAPNPWFKMEGLRAPDSSTLSGWYHTWNASDTGTSVTFTFVPAPTLGIGDKDLPNANAVALSVVFNGASSTALLQHNGYGSAQDLVQKVSASPLKLPAAASLHCVAAVSPGIPGILDLDPQASSIVANGTASMYMALYERAATPAGYAPAFTCTQPISIMIQALSVSDNQPQIYNPPYIEEGPMADNRLMFRYKLNRFFTVLNNGGVFTAVRYQSTDQIAAATQVFTNNQPISPTDRANLIASGVGGEFGALS